MQQVNIITIDKHVGEGGYYFMCVPDANAGDSHRYTLYFVPCGPNTTASGGVRVMGRELRLQAAKELARNLPFQVRDGEAPESPFSASV